MNMIERGKKPELDYSSLEAFQKSLLSMETERFQYTCAKREERFHILKLIEEFYGHSIVFDKKNIKHFDDFDFEEEWDPFIETSGTIDIESTCKMEVGIIHDYTTNNWTESLGLGIVLYCPDDDEKMASVLVSLGSKYITDTKPGEVNFRTFHGETNPGWCKEPSEEYLPEIIKQEERMKELSEIIREFLSKNGG